MSTGLIKEKDILTFGILNIMYIFFEYDDKYIIIVRIYL